jgi:hypothetical protein
VGSERSGWADVVLKRTILNMMYIRKVLIRMKDWKMYCSTAYMRSFLADHNLTYEMLPPTYLRYLRLERQQHIEGGES